MQLFLFLNDLAGRWPWLDELFRLVYVGTVPLLGTLLLARLTLVPKAAHDPSRFRIVLATLLAIGLCILTMLAINGLASLLLGGVLSPRPFMTRRVNLLIVEPQDNSFPAPEMMLAAAFALALASWGRRWAFTGAALTLLLAVARLYCGNNYLVDVVVGALIGAAWAGIALSLAGAPLRHVARPLQLGASSALLGLTLLGVYVGLTLQPRFATKLYAPWSHAASAAPALASKSEPGSPKAPKSARDAQGALQEGEGISEGEDDAHEAEALALSKRSTLFLPAVETFLRGRLAPRTRPFTLLDVEVAPVKAGQSAYRCAAVRFEIPAGTRNLRGRVAECAARLVKLCFLLDSQMQNVDVIAIVRGDGKAIDNSDATFVGDEVPVFTASVQRKNLYLKSPAWANLQTLDGGSWLRLRSRLFVNERVLPPAPGHGDDAVPQPQGTLLPVPPKTPTPTVKATVAPTPTTLPTPSVSPSPKASASPRPTPRPQITAAPTPTLTGKPTATPQPTATPNPTAKAPPSATPTSTPTALPSATARPTYRSTRTFRTRRNHSSVRRRPTKRVKRYRRLR